MKKFYKLHNFIDLKKFWCFFINLTTLTSSILGQGFFQALPGRNQIMFYTCSGSNLTMIWNKKYKLNYQFVVTLALALVVYIVVLIKVKLFMKKQALLPTISSQIETSGENSNSKWNFSIEKQTLMDFASVAITLSFYGPLLVSI